jgi:hypothetical protein
LNLLKREIILSIENIKTPRFGEFFFGLFLQSL